jgi:chaperonin GroEL
MKSLEIGKDARKAAVGALDKIASAVATTMGPRGMPFIIEKENSMDGKLSPTITKDGLTVLRSMSFGDPIQSAVHNLCVQASSHTVLSAGDGTTSTIVLASAIAKEILFSLEHAQKPQKLAREIQKQAAAAIAAIAGEAVKSEDAVRIVAETSTNGDQELTDAVMQVVAKSSAFGSIIIERDSMKKEKYQVVVHDGLVAGNGYEKCRQFGNTLSNKVGENAPFEIDTPKVICFDGELMYNTQLTPLLNKINAALGQDQNHNIIIAAYDVGNEIYTTLS